MTDATGSVVVEESVVTREYTADGRLIREVQPDGGESLVCFEDGEGFACQSSAGPSSNLLRAPNMVSMARGQDPNSAGSQFFVVHGEHAPHLDGQYSAFGQIDEGLEVLDEIAAVECDFGPRGERSVPSERIELIHREHIDVGCLLPRAEQAEHDQRLPLGAHAGRAVEDGRRVARRRATREHSNASVHRQLDRRRPADAARASTPCRAIGARH